MMQLDLFDQPPPRRVPWLASQWVRGLFRDERLTVLCPEHLCCSRYNGIRDHTDYPPQPGQFYPDFALIRYDGPDRHRY